jgi:hypothetical protein
LKQFQRKLLDTNKLAEPKLQLVNFSGLADKNGRFKIFGLFLKIYQLKKSLYTTFHKTPFFENLRSIVFEKIS